MAIICRDYKLLFILTPRTASSAVGRLLIEELGGENLPAEATVDTAGHFVLRGKHSTLDDLLTHGILTQAEADDLLTFTTVRNPFDSLVSLYIKRGSKYQPLIDDPDSWVHKVPGYAADMEYCRTHSFDQWIRKHYSRTAVKRLIGGKPSMYRRFTHNVDEVLCFEDLDKGFSRISEIAALPSHLTVPRFNTTVERESDYRSYYSASSRRLVEFALGSDLRRYNYHF